MSNQTSGKRKISAWVWVGIALLVAVAVILIVMFSVTKPPKGMTKTTYNVGRKAVHVMTKYDKGKIGHAEAKSKMQSLDQEINQEKLPISKGKITDEVANQIKVKAAISMYLMALDTEHTMFSISPVSSEQELYQLIYPNKQFDSLTAKSKWTSNPILQQRQTTKK